MPPESIQSRKNLSNLLGYAEEILKAGERVISDLAKDALATFHEHDVAGLEGVTVPDPDGYGCWLRVARLHENPAPQPDDDHLPWLALPRSAGGPFVPPQMVSTLLVTAVSFEDASELLAAGLAVHDDVMPRKGEREPQGDFVDVLLRLENMSEFAATFDAWVSAQWRAWEEAERPRRRSIAFYNRLFEIQQRSASMGDDTPIETIFGVGMAMWVHPAGKINAPLIEAAVELELDAGDGAIAVRPRPQPPRLALRPFDELEIAGVGRLQREASQQLERFYDDPDVGFSPHERAGFEPVLRMCHARLASDAVYEPDTRTEGERVQPGDDAKLRIADRWVIYVRQRSSNFRCDDIRRLAAAIEAAEDADLPPPALQMTKRPTDAHVDDDRVDLLNTSVRFPESADAGQIQAVGGGNGSGATREKKDRTYYFPLPYNDEQIEIIHSLERDDVNGVVVQGPPGTGKTHTIANIISHYMATGRRVLVSAHEPEALAAIQGKLPESIRDFAISVIHSDREGARRLEQAVEILASQVKLIDKRVYNDRRIDLESELARTRAALDAVDESIREYAHLNLTAVEFRGQKLIPMDLAARIEAERPRHAWFTDQISLATCFEPRFGNADILEAGRIRHELAGDVIYPSRELPDPSVLPDIPRLLAAHTALVSEKRADALAASGDLPYVSFSADAGIDEARALRVWLDDMAAWVQDIEATDGWLIDLYQLLTGHRVVHELTRDGVRTLCTQWETIGSEGRAFMLRGVEVPGLVSPDAAFDAAVEALANGRKPFGMFSFGKTANKLKEQIDAVRIDGGPPDGPEHWLCIRDYRNWQRNASTWLGKWSTVAPSAGFPAVSGEWPAVVSELLRLGSLVERLNCFVGEAHRHIEIVGALFPYGIDARQVVFHLEFASTREALVASLEREGHADARLVHRRLGELGASASLPFHTAIAEFAGALGDAQTNPRELADGWREVLEEAKRLDGLRVRRQRLEAIASVIASSGAPNWAAALLEEPARDGDPLAPDGWLQTWDWARADGHVRSLSNRGALAELSSRRSELEDKQRSLLAEIVRVRTFIGLKQGITERVAAALQKFAMKVRQLGAGTGKAAERHRRGIREATLDAASAVPCWILPEWRVAEQLPSTLAAFDLVIIDEASQSDITSLPAVLRGKKLLVVGDDKQVSPSAVGMEERTVIQLRETFLRGMDIANFLEPTTSLYDLASMTFPGSVVMLREHFRCVEPIIAFSSRFYPKALIPLRVPTSEERLDPPLVDVFVPDGHKVKDVNSGEADFIAGEIARLAALPEYARRTFGVISMIGDKQAKFVQDRLVEAVGTEAIARHRIMCGNASTFQGQERDVIFLSLVACPKTARAQTARLMEQRFNVAMSRARDRMYLVRSVAASMLSPNDLKLAVIEHFRNPMADAVAARDKEVLDETESPFEHEVGGLLLDRGYRVRPQVRVGGYRIDFVVEGDGDRRLAVELDGDRYHGPERWFEDVHRQRALERLGWTFWRCWGSHWFADRQQCLDDLLAVLGRLGIEPVGGEMTPQIWTEHRVHGASADTDPETRIRPTLAEVIDVPDGTASTASVQNDRDVVVEVGDTVIVRFADDNRVMRFRLGAGPNSPDPGVVSSAQPIAQALLGNGLEEEVDLTVGGSDRRVIIEKITKAA